MGRDKYSSRFTVEDSQTLSIYELNHWGFLKEDELGIFWVRKYHYRTPIGVSADAKKKNGSIKLIYGNIQSAGKVNLIVNLITTPCNFGGFRYWFECPQCTRRTAALYLPPLNLQFGCRDCYSLTYESRRKKRNALYIAINAMCTAQKLEEKITRSRYGNMPTRKQRKIDKLWERTGNLYNHEIRER